MSNERIFKPGDIIKYIPDKDSKIKEAFEQELYIVISAGPYIFEEGFQMVEKMHLISGVIQMRPIMINRWEILA